MRSATRKLNMWRAGWRRLKTRGSWAADCQRGPRQEMRDGAAQELTMEGVQPVRADGRAGLVRLNHEGSAGYRSQAQSQRRVERAAMSIVRRDRGLRQIG
jgi:hypothetical protein